MPERVGLSAEKILEAPRATVREVARKGIEPEQTVEKLRAMASIALEKFGGDHSSYRSGQAIAEAEIPRTWAARRGGRCATGG